MTTTAINQSRDYTIVDGIPVIKIYEDIYFDVLDSCLLIGDEVYSVTDEIIAKWNNFRLEVCDPIVCNTTKPHIPEALGFERRIDDGTNYRFISRV